MPETLDCRAEYGADYEKGMPVKRDRFIDKFAPVIDQAQRAQWIAFLDAVIGAKVAEEREACAKVADTESTRQEALYQSAHQYMYRHAGEIVDDVADDIRARGK